MIVVINELNQGAAGHGLYHQWIPMMIQLMKLHFAGWMDEGFNNC